VASFVEFARKNRSTTLSYGSAGIGIANHLCGEWFNPVAGLDLNHVPYRGDAAAVVDLLSGTLQICFITPTVGMPLVAAGKLQPFAVTSPTRQEFLPQVPTMQEAGYPGFVLELFNGLVGPVGTPAEIVARLNREVNEIAGEPAVVARLADMGSCPMTMSSTGFSDFLHQQTAHWRSVIQQAHIPLLD
jgi:tripartite-type tricarboxylate transporter receptor subunit TctC